RVTYFAYDKLNRLRYTIDAEGYLTENQYDVVGNVRYQTRYFNKPNSLGSSYTEANITSKKVTHAQDRKIEYRYDNANRLVAELSPTTNVYVSSVDNAITKNYSSYSNARIKTVTTY